MKLPNQKFFWSYRTRLLFLPFLCVCGCDHETEPTYIPPEVTEMQGIWKLDLTTDFRTDSVTYTLEITNGSLALEATTSNGWPYDLPSALSATQLLCKKGNALMWEVPIKGLAVHANRAMVAITLTFQVSSPYGVFSFECYARWGDGKTGPDEWSGSVYVDHPSTGAIVDGYGSFTAFKQQ